MKVRPSIVIACVAVTAAGVVGASASALASAGGRASPPVSESGSGRLGGAPLSALGPGGQAAPLASGYAPGRRAPGPVICVRHIPATEPGVVKQPYWIYDDSWATRTCIQLHKGIAFKVETSAHSTGRYVVAYPSIVYGDYYGYVTPGSDLPVRIKQMGKPHMTVRAGGNANGVWIGDFDSWFFPTPNTDNHSRIEMVVIVRYPHYLSMRGGKVIIINHRKWWLRDWITCIRNSKGGCVWSWPLIRYALVDPTRHITIPFRAFVNIARSRGMLPRSYWWGSTAFGYENWSGGRGEFVRLNIRRGP